jgi:putative IMPACT (imprinted ancient) family translation regulator
LSNIRDEGLVSTATVGVNYFRGKELGRWYVPSNVNACLFDLGTWKQYGGRENSTWHHCETIT